MLKAFKSDNGMYGIEDDETLLYEPDFISFAHAHAIAEAHNNGAFSFEDALDTLPQELAQEIIDS